MHEEAKGPQEPTEEGSQEPRAEEPQGPQADFDMEFVPKLPGGRAAVPAEREGRFVWMIAEGHMSEQCMTEMRQYLQHIVSTGMWQQNWDGKPPSRQPENPQTEPPQEPSS